MHEVALCQSIKSIGLRACEGRRVTRVTVDVGALRQVVPPTLVAAWRFVTSGTLLADSELAVNEIPAVISCEACGWQTQLDQPYMVCGHCGGTAVSVVSGREFMLRSIDVTSETTRSTHG